MAHRNQGSVARQVESLRRQFGQAPGLPFAELLAPELIQQIFQDHEIDFRERDYPPLVTLAMFLSQCHDADQSLRQAVARRLAYQVAQGEAEGSANTGAYCKARQRLPEEVLADLTRHAGRQVQRAASAAWSWRGRNVKVVDGSTASMPDTPANQEVYPQANTQKPGLGFPILRFLVVFSLAVGTVLDAAFGPYKGKETSELALFRSLYDNLENGDVILGDRHFCSFFAIAELQRRGIDVVLRQHQARRTDFRRGVWLGAYDHLVLWDKPQRPEWMDEETYQQYPDVLVMREVHIPIRDRKVRCRALTLATTLLDDRRYSKRSLAKLYRLRWQAELHLRSLKTVLQMDVLRCKTPEMVRKELWVHLLAYNLIRKLMAQAAQHFNVRPWRISFKGTLQTLNAFRLPLLTCPASRFPEVLEAVFLAIAHHEVGNRPNRLEPRCIKRRPKPHDLLLQPRPQARKLELAK